MPPRVTCLSWSLSLALLALSWLAPAGWSLETSAVTSASSTAPGSSPAGAIDGHRFGTNSARLWRGQARETNWWWEIRFAAPFRIGAILQVVGDHDFVFQNAPTHYVWQASVDGRTWRDLRETRQDGETRCYRIHRLKRVRGVTALRLRIDRTSGSAPVLREVEFHESTGTPIAFPDWIVAVNTTHDPTLPGHGQEFIPLARSCEGHVGLQAQQIWLDTFDPKFLETEPRPLCAFLSGSFKDWCEVDRKLWRGTAAVLRQRRVPIWASCGGAQGLAILAETGVNRPWDCPHCRNPRRPLLPIYSHIGHTAVRPCGDYSGCVFERGPHLVRQEGDDPVFAGLPAEFRVMESHCGQIEWAPKGWERIATAGPGTQTKTQCLRLKGTRIYAAQFHIEMDGTPDISRRIMANFLRLGRP